MSIVSYICSISSIIRNCFISFFSSVYNFIIFIFSIISCYYIFLPSWRFLKIFIIIVIKNMYIVSIYFILFWLASLLILPEFIWLLFLLLVLVLALIIVLNGILFVSKFWFISFIIGLLSKYSFLKGKLIPHFNFCKS